MKAVLAVWMCCCYALVGAQDSARMALPKQPELLFRMAPAKDSVTFKTPKYKQGFFCDFEDMLHRKRIPVNFSLGNSKY